MDNQMDKYIGRMLDDRYELLEVIGAGGMAVVYKALCHRLNRYVAVKILRDDSPPDSDSRRRFRSESQAVAMLSHPNIVAVYDVSHSDDVEYIVMELIEGITLKEYMKKRGVLSWKETLHFSTQIVKALSHAHSKGIVHRDIKPHNIMILSDGTIKVADFGIACLMSAEESGAEETLGSVHYVSPEQARGGAVDARSDIYSVGVVMYEMLTGRLPYEGDTPEQIALQHLSAVPTPPRELNPEIPEGLANIVMRAMEANIDERYSSADEMLEDLEEFRKSQAAAVMAEENGLNFSEEDGYIVKRDVAPISTSGELSAESYKRRRSRARKVSMLTGFFCVIAFILAVFIFLWNFWLKGIFEDAERLEMPSFVGEDVDHILADPAYTDTFVFQVTTVIDPDTPEGTILDQTPEAGRSVMIVPEGISVELTVSSGQVMVQMPDVVNMDYRQAVTDLQKLGFTVEIEVVADPAITEDYVVSSIPAEGEELPAGSTVFLRVSGGPEIVMVQVPNLVGYYESTARSMLESKNLTIGSVSYDYSDEYGEGVVMWQNVEAYTEVEEHTKIYIKVSQGPKETPSPSAEPSPSPSETPSPSVTTSSTPSADPQPSAPEPEGEV